MAIGKHARKDVVCISEDASLFEAAQMMKQKNVGSIVVVKDQASDLTPTGILTDRDIVTKLLADDVNLKNVSVKDTLTQALLAIKEDERTKSAMELMQKHGIRRAPVVNQEGKVSGIISLDDLFILLIDKLSILADVIKKQMH